MTKKKSGGFLAKWGIVLAVLVAFLAFSILAPKVFLSVSNVLTILQSISITTVIAMGATIGFAAGVFDLSFGSLATLGAAMSCTLIAWYGLPMPLAIICAILICMIVSLINTIVVVKFHVTAFLATLAMQFILDGVIQTYSGGSVINPRVESASGHAIVRKVPDAFWALGKQPWIIIIMFICVIVVEFFLNYTKHGRILYMVGASPKAAEYSGVKVGFYIGMAFFLTAVFSAIGGTMIVARAGTLQSSAGTAFLMPSIAAANIGYSFGGRGKASALGTFVGAALIGVVENGLYALAFPYYSINIVKGIILLIALVMSGITSARAAD